MKGQRSVGVSAIVMAMALLGGQGTAQAGHPVTTPLVGTGGTAVSALLNSAAVGSCSASVVIVFDEIHESINPPGIGGVFHTEAYATCPTSHAEVDGVFSSHATVYDADGDVVEDAVDYCSTSPCSSPSAEFDADETIEGWSFQTYEALNGTTFTFATPSMCTILSSTSARCHANATLVPGV